MAVDFHLTIIAKALRLLIYTSAHFTLYYCANIFIHFVCNYRFHYMAISDDRQRIMPMPDDRMPERCQQLAYPEAVLLTNPINPDLKGEVS